MKPCDARDAMSNITQTKDGMRDAKHLNKVTGNSIILEFKDGHYYFSSRVDAFVRLEPRPPKSSPIVSPTIEEIQTYNGPK